RHRHPTQAPQRLTFSIEWQGADRIERDGAQAELGRYAIRIRNGSAYVAWADAQGRLVRLIPLPLQGAAPGLTRGGCEKAAAGPGVEGCAPRGGGPTAPAGPAEGVPFAAGGPPPQKEQTPPRPLLRSQP